MSSSTGVIPHERRCAQVVERHVRSVELLWHLVSSSASVEAASRGPPKKAHGDHHRVLLPTPSVSAHAWSSICTSSAAPLTASWAAMTRPPASEGCGRCACCHHRLRPRRARVGRRVNASTTTRARPSQACPLATSGSVPPSRGPPPSPPSTGWALQRAARGRYARGPTGPAVGLRRRHAPRTVSRGRIIFLSPARRGHNTRWGWDRLPRWLMIARQPRRGGGWPLPLPTRPSM